MSIKRTFSDCLNLSLSLLFFFQISALAAPAQNVVQDFKTRVKDRYLPEHWEHEIMLYLSGFDRWTLRPNPKHEFLVQLADYETFSSLIFETVMPRSNKIYNFKRNDPGLGDIYYVQGYNAGQFRELEHHLHMMLWYDAGKIILKRYSSLDEDAGREYLEKFSGLIESLKSNPERYVPSFEIQDLVAILERIEIQKQFERDSKKRIEDFQNKLLAVPTFEENSDVFQEFLVFDSKKSQEGLAKLYRDQIQEASGASIARHFDHLERSLPALVLSYVSAIPRGTYFAGKDFERLQRSAADVFIGSLSVLIQAQGVSAEQGIAAVELLRVFSRYFELNRPVLGMEGRWVEEFRVASRKLEELSKSIEADLSRVSNPSRVVLPEAVNSVRGVLDRVSGFQERAEKRIPGSFQVYDQKEWAAVRPKSPEEKRVISELESLLPMLSDAMIRYSMAHWLEICLSRALSIKNSKDYFGEFERVELSVGDPKMAYETVFLSRSKKGTGIIFSNLRASFKKNEIMNGFVLPESVFLYQFPSYGRFLVMEDVLKEPLIHPRVKEIFEVTLGFRSLHTKETHK